MSHVRRVAPLFEGVKAHLDGLEKTIEAFGHHDMERLAEAVCETLAKVVEATSDEEQYIAEKVAQAVKDRMNADDFLGGIKPATLGGKAMGCSKWPE